MMELREKLEVGRDGTTFLQLVDLLKQYGFHTKSYKVDAAHIDCIPTPSIILWDDRHFVVLEKINKNCYVIVDPAIGTVRVNKEEFYDKFSEYVVYAEPGNKFTRVKKKHQGWKNFLPYLFENKMLYLKVMVSSFILYLCTLGLPLLTQKVIDQLITNVKAFDISLLGVLIAGIGLLYFLTTIIKNFFMIQLRGTLDRSLNSNIFRHLLQLPYRFFSVRSSGDLVYSLNSTMAIREIFANQFITAVINCGAAILILCYIFSVSRILGIVACVLFLLNVFVVGATQSVLADNSRALTTSKSNVQSVQVEAVYSMLGVKMSGIEDDIYQSWKEMYQRYYRRFNENEKVSNYINSFMGLLQFMSPTCILFISLYFVTKSMISIGQVISVYSLSSTFFGLSSSVFNLWTSFIHSGVIFERLIDIINTKVENNNEELEMIQLSGAINLKNVSFSYTKDSKKVLKNINLTIEPGMKVALVGKSGSGKSTLANLLVGLYLPVEGDIYYDSYNLLNMNRKEVRKQIGIVPQNITLFNKSIYDNVVMNRAGVTLDDVKKACEIAHIKDDIEAMPMGYYTQVTDVGRNLSGGQRQRVALARAIIGRPKILLLDEATSSLDNINEKMVSDEFKLMGTTQVVIAHRLSTIIDSDLILVLDEGKIVEQGTHESLIQQNGIYRQLYQLGG